MNFGWYIYRAQTFRLRPRLKRQSPYWAVCCGGLTFTNLNVPLTERMLAALAKARGESDAG